MSPISIIFWINSDCTFEGLVKLICAFIALSKKSDSYCLFYHTTLVCLTWLYVMRS